jgi:PIN domain nuclease of toxin-antitoxin system
VLILAVNAWEIGMLVAKRRIALNRPPSEWWARLAALPGLRVAPLDPAVALAASFLRKPFHGDPADRLPAAPALALEATLVTRDRRLLDSAKRLGLRTLPC